MTTNPSKSFEIKEDLTWIKILVMVLSFIMVSTFLVDISLNNQSLKVDYIFYIIMGFFNLIGFLILLLPEPVTEVNDKSISLVKKKSTRRRVLWKNAIYAYYKRWGEMRVLVIVDNKLNEVAFPLGGLSKLKISLRDFGKIIQQHINNNKA